MSNPKTVKGVRVNCLGDREKCHRPHYEPVEISTTDPIFLTGHTSDITDRIGIPIFTRQCPKNPIWLNGSSSRGEGYASSSEAAFLHVSCDTSQRFNPRALLSAGAVGFGWAPEPWQYGPGSFIAVRQDKKPLDPIHMEALCRYCVDHAQPLFGHSMGEYAPDEPLSKQEVLGMISRATFSIFWYSRFTKERDVDALLSDLYEA
ncbi:hypothetical protein TWF481_000165 [Arthrobotrys musiformis]|uniref:Uncharacterized protein n=1 Tax=Arthrobotrys musiformis TaxID=47236 RepID=A0AAV9WLT0_9PEZI